MFHLVYASTAVKAFSTEELLDLLESCRKYNAALRITGMLLYKQGSFMQALEGEEQAVRTLYEAICRDSRHHHVRTLVAIQVPKPLFPEWTMGFQNLDDSDWLTASGHSPKVIQSELINDLSFEGSIAMRMLATFMHQP